MNVGLLLITHHNVATSLLETAQQMLETQPLTTRVLEVPLDHPVEDIIQQGEKYLQSLDSGSGVLILTDMYGSTPSNIAKQLCDSSNCRLVSGLNLPMLVRVLNYPQLDLESLSLKAHSGGVDGIIICECNNNI